ncbi:hypothetical protein F4808DRAFT_436970 [Astrocystis sublimbata]|nr:hypothetical protein F4808DRAFT_436970 [Astrocystis sublimbata]
MYTAQRTCPRSLVQQRANPVREERCYPIEHQWSQPRFHGEGHASPGLCLQSGTPGVANHLNSGCPINQRYIRDTPESPKFYGLDGTQANEVEQLLRYQNRLDAVGAIPGPDVGLRLKLDDYIKDTGSNSAQCGLENKIAGIYFDTYYSGETLDDETAIQQNWTRGKTSLYKGFPLVEDVGFVAAGNHEQPSGDCYWRALAYSLYGTPDRWNQVKADHQVFLSHVLHDQSHHRHKLYSILNAKWFNSSGPMLDGRPKAFQANMWQLLHMPHSWTPGIMQQVTADLYNLHLITFEYSQRTNLCSNVSVRGAYNSRHIFMLYINANHFQPLTPNEHFGWEFKYPRVSVAKTARFSNAPKVTASAAKDGLRHPWRNEYTKEVPPPVSKMHGCDFFRLKDHMAIHKGPVMPTPPTPPQQQPHHQQYQQGHPQGHPQLWQQQQQHAHQHQVHQHQVHQHQGHRPPHQQQWQLQQQHQLQQQQQQHRNPYEPQFSR